MDDWQRGEAIRLLLEITGVPEEEIEEYEDYALEAWCNELGYEWDETSGIIGAGAWVEMW